MRPQALTQGKDINVICDEASAHSRSFKVSAVDDLVTAIELYGAEDLRTAIETYGTDNLRTTTARDPAEFLRALGVSPFSDSDKLP